MAEYQGKKVKLNKPFRMPKGNSKKFGVYTKNGKGNVVIVRFGDPNMEIKRDDPKRRKAFRDRHNCANAGPKWKPRYWSCKMWSTKSVTDLTSDFNKTPDTVEDAMGNCGCGDCGCKETVEAKMEDYIFMSRDAAIKKSQEIGFEGDIHESTTADGGTLYFPAKTEDEFLDWYRENDPDAESELSAAEPTPKDDETHDQYMSRCEEAGYTTEECMAAHDGHTFMEEASYHTDGGCRNGYEEKNGMCVKVAFNLDIDITVDETVIEASTGKQIIRITGIAFHDGINKNGWEITRKGADLAVSQMVGADLTLNHPPAENGRFSRNMDGGVEDAIVGIVTEAFVLDTEEGWEVGFKAEVHRPELFEALESGMWLRPDYGVSIGGTGIPDMVTEHKDGKVIMTFESDFAFDHLAIVHRPAYPRANIHSVEKVQIGLAREEAFISQADSEVNIEKVNLMIDEEIITIEASEEDVIETVAEEVIETPDYSAEIAALKASLAEKESEVTAFKAAEESKIEEMRLSLVSKATSLGMSGHDELSSETLESLIASWEASKPAAEVEMKPIKASTDVEVLSTPVGASDSVVANFLNGRKLQTPESIYEKAFNVWASAWNKTNSEPNSKAPTYAEAKENLMI